MTVKPVDVPNAETGQLLDLVGNCCVCDEPIYSDEVGSTSNGEPNVCAWCRQSGWTLEEDQR